MHRRRTLDRRSLTTRARTALHEAAHAVAAIVLGRADSNA
jgi:hypothetical protein